MSEQSNPNEDLLKRIAELEARLPAQTTQDEKEAVSDEKIDEFLKTPRPDTELYYVTDVRSSHLFQLISDTPEGREGDPNSRGRRKPALNLEMHRPSHGIGEDLKDARGQKKYWIYVCDVAKLPLVKITERDLKDKELLLADDVKLNPKGEYTLDQAMDALKDLPSYRRGQIITGEQFRVKMEGEYEKIRAARKIDRETNQKFQNLSPAERKAGLAFA